MEAPERNSDGAPRRRVNSTIVAAGVAFGITLAGLGVAAAQTDGGESTDTTQATTETTAAPTTESSDPSSATTQSESTSPTTEAPSSTTDPDSSTDKRARRAETLLTGETADKVSAAALAAVPGGTVIRVETDSDGSPYEAHVRKADGTEVVVKVDASFAVTSVEEGRAGGGHHGRRGPGGPGGPGGDFGGTILSGDQAEQASAAALAAVPGGTVIRAQSGPGENEFHVHVRKADGTEVVVHLDASFTVTSTEDAPAGGHGMRGPRPAEGDTETD